MYDKELAAIAKLKADKFIIETNNPLFYHKVGQYS